MRSGNPEPDAPCGRRFGASGNVRVAPIILSLWSTQDSVFGQGFDFGRAQRVCSLNQAVKGCLTAWLFQIKRDGPLVAVEGGEESGSEARESPCPRALPSLRQSAR